MGYTKTPEEVVRLKQRAQKMLDDYVQQEQFGFHLKVSEEYDRQEDDWLYLVVLPDKDGVPANEYVEALSVVEMRLRRKENEHVLLVPALVD